jgi:hypothetical protein
VLVLGFALGLWLGPRLVRAQDDPNLSASARALFEEGMSFADGAQWDQAADRFRRALSLRDSPVIRFNLAAALGQLNKPVEASELLQRTLRDASAEGEVKAQAEQLLAQLTPRIARLTLHVQPDAGGLELMLDGRTLAAAQIGVALPLDPGLHRARLVRAQEELEAREIELSPGQSGSLVLHSPLSPARVAAAAVAPSAPPSRLQAADRRKDEEPSARNRRKTWLWVGVAGGAAVVIGAVVAGVLLAQRGDHAAAPYQGDFEPGSVAVKVTP